MPTVHHAVPPHPLRTSWPRPGRALRAAPWWLGAGLVAVQVVFPLAGGTLPLTLAAVYLFALASVVHALVHRGPVAAGALVVVAGGGGLLVEAVGLTTGFPFGSYAYSGTLGPELLGVPAVVPAAWTMMAYPALLVGRRLGTGWWSRVGVGAWALASWDVFLDPQMVDAGHWRWSDPTPSLPGVEGIPLTNFAGWLLVAALMIAVLDRVTGRRDEPDDRLPYALYLWTYASSVLAHLVFFGRPSVAFVGAVLMGLVALPLATGLRRRGTGG